MTLTLGITLMSIRRHLHSFLLIMMTYAYAFSSMSRMSYSDEQMTEVKAKTERYACGPRAVFVLIRMIGGDATYSTVCDHMNVSEKGCSLDDMRNALLTHDVQCAVRRLQLTELPSTPLPFIVHVMPGNDALDAGHFIIVTDIDKGGVHTYDPVTNQELRWAWRTFSDWWSGYAIVTTQSTIWTRQRIMPYVIGIHLLLVVCVVAALGRKIWRLLTAPDNVRCFVAAVIVLTFGLSQSTDASAEELLRSNMNDGANAVALLGGICDVEIPPGQAEGIDACDSLRKVQLRLQAHGVAASVRFLGYNELASINRPCIVPLRTAGNDKTTFCVFVQANSSDIHFVDAGPLIAHVLSIDEFRRCWTGYAVFGDATAADYRGLLGAALLGLGAPLATYAIINHARQFRGLRQEAPARPLV